VFCHRKSTSTVFNKCPISAILSQKHSHSIDLNNKSPLEARAGPNAVLARVDVPLEDDDRSLPDDENEASDDGNDYIISKQPSRRHPGDDQSLVSDLVEYPANIRAILRLGNKGLANTIYSHFSP
jgi:hypothetical protein